MITFPTAGDTPRPVRLPRAVREWAYESLRGKYGDEAARHSAVTLDDVTDFDTMSPLERYDTAIRRIAERAPIRLCEREEIAGSATLGLAIKHVVPATYRGQSVFPSVSHLTIDYERALKLGLDDYEKEIDGKLPHSEGKRKELLASMKHTLESMRIWHTRYLNALKEKAGGKAERAYRLLEKVPFSPAETFAEAVQAVWFVFAFVRLTGNWPGIGRLDKLLGPYYERDLKAKRVTKREARLLLASFFIKGAEWVRSDAERGSGDAQHYQNIVLGGVDEAGREVANPVTYLILEIVEELPVSDFPITLRINAGTPERLLEKAAAVIRHGGGVGAFYDERSIIEGMLSCGYPVSDARNFANDGCWEVQVPGATCFSYVPFDGLRVFNRAVGLAPGRSVPDFQNAEQLFAAFENELQKEIDAIYHNYVVVPYGADGKAAGQTTPTTVIDLFEIGCVEKGLPYFGLGPKYTVRSPHLGGAPDVANSILAVQKLVFEQKRLTFPALVQCLRDNWKNAEPLRLYAKNKIAYYGNDDDEADGYMRRVVEIFCRCVEKTASAHAGHPVRFVPGVSTFGRQIEWTPMREATAFGGKKGDILSGNGSPTPGTDFAGATAVVRSYCKCNPARATCGAALDLKIFPESLKGQNGIAALVSIFKAFVALKGSFVQIDTVDTQTLLDARARPEDYKTLSVRVSGWNARFVTLSEEWQNMIIERTGQTL